MNLRTKDTQQHVTFMGVGGGRGLNGHSGTIDKAMTYRGGISSSDVANSPFLFSLIMEVNYAKQHYLSFSSAS